MNGQLVITPGDALLFLVWAGSLSLIISGVLIYPLMSGSLGTAVIFMGILVSLMAGGGLDMRAFRRLRQGGRWYDMPSVRKEFFWKPRTLRQALSLTLPGTTPRGAVKVLLGVPVFAILLGVTVRLWP